jgi:hypothetical protein
MYLVNCKTHDLVEIMDEEALFDPFKSYVTGRYHAGEELQDEQLFDKCELSFQSGECLPQCWTDSHFRDYDQNLLRHFKVA